MVFPCISWHLISWNRSPIKCLLPERASEPMYFCYFLLGFSPYLHLCLCVSQKLSMTAMFGKESFRTPVPRLQKTGSAKGEAIEIISSAMGMTSGEATERVGGQGFTLDPFRVARTPKTFEPTFACSHNNFKICQFHILCSAFQHPQNLHSGLLATSLEFWGSGFLLESDFGCQARFQRHELWFPSDSVRI